MLDLPPRRRNMSISTSRRLMQAPTRLPGWGRPARGQRSRSRKILSTAPDSSAKGQRGVAADTEEAEPSRGSNIGSGVTKSRPGQNHVAEPSARFFAIAPGNSTGQPVGFQVPLRLCSATTIRGRSGSGASRKKGSRTRSSKPSTSTLRASIRSSFSASTMSDSVRISMSIEPRSETRVSPRLRPPSQQSARVGAITNGAAQDKNWKNRIDACIESQPPPHSGMRLYRDDPPARQARGRSSTSKSAIRADIDESQNPVPSDR